MKLIIKDNRPPKVSEIRKLFELSINNTPNLKTLLDLTARQDKEGGEFQGYLNDATDDVWFGFAFGMRCARRLSETRPLILPANGELHGPPQEMPAKIIDLL